jgi:rsbT co-antagonist protein RsbR
VVRISFFGPGDEGCRVSDAVSMQSTPLNSSLTASEALALFDLTSEDLERVRAFGSVCLPGLDRFIDLFYQWFDQNNLTRQWFTEESLPRVQAQQKGYWTEFFAGQVDELYMRQREMVGTVHARIGLPLPTYFASVDLSFRLWVERIYPGGLSHEDFSKTVCSFTKLLHLDTNIVVESYTRMTSKQILDQRKAILEMATPVTSIWKDILLLPIVGFIDSRRATEIMSNVLEKIASVRAKVLILDISGVAVVDSAVANHLVKITKAAKLMGCEAMISGLSPAVAQTMVTLGLDVERIQTTNTLQDALEKALSKTGVKISS